MSLQWQDMRVKAPGWAWCDAVLRWRARQVIVAGDLARSLAGARRIADAGCGTGHLTEALLDVLVSAEVEMFDPCWDLSPRLRDRLAQRHSGRWTHTKAGFPGLGTGSARYDAVMLAFVLHHISFDEHASVLAEAHAMMRAGGQLILFEDTPVSARDILRTERADHLLNGEFGRRAPNAYRGPEEWRRLLRTSGFDIVEERAVGGIGPRVTSRPVPMTFFRAKSIT